MLRNYRVLLIAALVALSLGLAACGGDDDDEATTPAKGAAEVRSFVGNVPGTDALVAVVGRAARDGFQLGRA